MLRNHTRNIAHISVFPLRYVGGNKNKMTCNELVVMWKGGVAMNHPWYGAVARVVADAMRILTKSEKRWGGFLERA